VRETMFRRSGPDLDDATAAILAALTDGGGG
jgi:hypothetical protein